MELLQAYGPFCNSYLYRRGKYSNPPIACQVKLYFYFLVILLSHKRLCSYFFLNYHTSGKKANIFIRKIQFLNNKFGDILEKTVDFSAFIGTPTPIHYQWRPNLKDEADNMFVELALASGSEYLITRNVRDYIINNELLFDSFRITTPSEFLHAWRNPYGT